MVEVIAGPVTVRVYFVLIETACLVRLEGTNLGSAIRFCLLWGRKDIETMPCDLSDPRRIAQTALTGLHLSTRAALATELQAMARMTERRKRSCRLHRKEA